jgi:hypothetical protein
MSAALAAQGVHGGSASDRVEIVVRSATTRPTAVGSDHQIHTARLAIAVRVFGVRSREIELTDERSYPLVVADSLGSSSARAAAFDALARSLTTDAVSWILYGPMSSPPEVK